MITFSDTIKTLLQNPVLESFYIINIFDTYMKTSYYSDIEYNGQTYLADGSILQVESPQLTSVVDKQPFKITLADNGMELGQYADNGVVGLPVSVWIAFVDPMTETPNLTDTLLIYKGKIDQTSYSISTSAIGSSQFVATCTSPMSDLDQVRAVYTSQDYLDKNHPGDTSYEQVYEGSGPIALKWGKV